MNELDVAAVELNKAITLQQREAIEGYNHCIEHAHKYQIELLLQRLSCIKASLESSEDQESEICDDHQDIAAPMKPWPWISDFERSCTTVWPAKWMANMQPRRFAIVFFQFRDTFLEQKAHFGRQSYVTFIPLTSLLLERTWRK